MHPYIVDTEFAVTELLQLATAEEDQLTEQAAKLPSLEEKLRVHKWDFESGDLDDDFSDAYVMAAYGRMARAAHVADAVQKEVAVLQARVVAHQRATQAIAGAILQIAKQKLSLVHGDLKSAPEGRMIGSACVRDIIWQARNHALPFEEGTFRRPLIDLFTTLEQEQGVQFSLATHAKQSRAKQVLRRLGWLNYPAYLRDMTLLLP